MTSLTYDSIVIGLGAVGAATLLQLTRRGQRVLGLDRWDPPHPWGSTHGDTRITRRAIGEGEQYVPLVTRSHEIWRETEAETGKSLLVECGAMILAAAGNAAIVRRKPGFVRSTIAAAQRCAIPHEVLGADEAMRRFPQFRLRGDEIVYYEPGGGYVCPEACVAAQLALARRGSAVVRTNTRVTSIARDGAGVRVNTAGRETFAAPDAVLAAGAWSAGLGGPSWRRTWKSSVKSCIGFHGRARRLCAGPLPRLHMSLRRSAGGWVLRLPVPPGTEGVKVAMEQYTEVAEDPDRLRRAVTPDEVGHMYSTHLQTRMPSLRP
ncbi:MAG: N-methyl-L-tryptophan oxidase, partial [Acetobacteraceae bacterium]|nr:N-methyl-L-tryptophan oxidase [Acetobacteraceae bacterium]